MHRWSPCIGIILVASAALTAGAANAQSTFKRFLSLGYEPTGTTPEALAAIMATDTVRWGPIIKRSGFSE